MLHHNAPGLCVWSIDDSDTVGELTKHGNSPRGLAKF